MKLSKLAIIVCRGSKDVKDNLSEALGASKSSIYRLIDENKENGPLTTASALRVIREESGLGDDQLLEEIKESVAQN